MPASSDKVMSMVEEELRKNPNVSTAELYQKAQKIDKDIAKLSSRQFNARYPLQIKRRTAPARPRARANGRRRGRAAAVQVDRNAIRGVLLQLAKDVAAAEGKADVVEVISGVDKYVDRVVKAAGVS